MWFTLPLKGALKLSTAGECYAFKFLRHNVDEKIDALYLFIYSFIYLFIYLFIYSFIDLSIYLIMDLFIYSI